MVVGVNYEVQFFKFEAQPGPHFKLTFISSAVRNTFIQDIKTVGNTVFVGDLMRAVSVYELKE